MRASEYIAKATTYIGDPVKAREVRRELEAHLREATADIEAQGTDPETAELVAVARMGDPEKVALALAEAHHQSIPWRHYLALVPGLVLLVSHQLNGYFGTWPAAKFWYAMLAFCLVPNLSTLKRWAMRLRVDATAKYHWVLRQPLRAAFLSGIAAGGMAGGLFAAALWTAQGGHVASPFLAMLFLVAVPLAASVGALSRFRPQAPATFAAGFAALVFPLISLPVISADAHEFVEGLTVSGGYAFFILAAGWVIDRLAAKRQVFVHNPDISKHYDLHPGN